MEAKYNKLHADYKVLQVEMENLQATDVYMRKKVVVAAEDEATWTNQQKSCMDEVKKYKSKYTKALAIKFRNMVEVKQITGALEKAHDAAKQ